MSHRELGQCYYCNKETYTYEGDKYLCPGCRIRYWNNDPRLEWLSLIELVEEAIDGLPDVI